MATDRWVLLGLAPPRAEWARDLTRWASSAAVPAEFVKCLSADEARVRLRSGRRWSALLVDASVAALDPDLVADAGSVGVTVLLVRNGLSPGWSPSQLGIAATLSEVFGRDELLDALAAHAIRVPVADQLPPALSESTRPAVWQGTLLGVCGPGGTGASTIAIALAQGLAPDPRNARGVLLADLALRADLAMLHDATDLGPGIQELVDGHRLGHPDPEEIARHTFEVPARGYRLLLGLRRPGAWSALRPRAVDETLAGLRRTFPVVVADFTGDVEGETECGSLDVQERNHLARAVASSADLVLVVGAPGLTGVHALARLLGELVGAGVATSRLVPMLSRAPRDPGTRSQIGRALAELAPGPWALATPIWVRERKIEQSLRDGSALPRQLVDAVTVPVSALLDSRPQGNFQGAEADERVAPGSLGVWPGDGGP
jgi:hypothetical protein